MATRQTANRRVEDGVPAVQRIGWRIWEMAGQPEDPRAEDPIELKGASEPEYIGWVGGVATKPLETSTVLIKGPRRGEKFLVTIQRIADDRGDVDPIQTGPPARTRRDLAENGPDLDGRD